MIIVLVSCVQIADETPRVLYNGRGGGKEIFFRSKWWPNQKIRTRMRDERKSIIYVLLNYIGLVARIRSIKNTRYYDIYVMYTVPI